MSSSSSNTPLGGQGVSTLSQQQQAALPQTSVTVAGGGSGQQYVSTIGPPASINDLATVKNAMLSFLERRDQRILEMGLAPGDANEATLCWGGLTPIKKLGLDSGRSVINSRRSSDPAPDQPLDPLYVWNEKERFVIKKKITNPEDEDQYVWVHECKVMTITAPNISPFDGKEHVFKFDGKVTILKVEE